MPVVSMSLPDADRLIVRAEIRLEQYRIALNQTPDDAKTRGMVQGLEDAVATLRGFVDALRRAHEGEIA